MKNILFILVSALLLGGCAAHSVNINSAKTPIIPEVKNPVSVNYSFTAASNMHTANSVLADKYKAEKAPNAYMRESYPPDYILRFDIYSYNKTTAGFGCFPAIITLGIIPCKTGTYYEEIHPFLVNNKNKQETALPVQMVNGSQWLGWFAALGAAFSPNVYLGGHVTSSYLQDTYKYAASVVYDGHGDAQKIKSKMAKIKAAPKVSSEDADFFAKYAVSFEDFTDVKNKASALNACQSMHNILFENKNKPLSKDAKAYWSGLDYYRNNCVQKDLYKDDPRLGMTREVLIKIVGEPAQTYKQNDDTEILAYERVFDTGRDKTVTSLVTYTLDKGIVSEVKEGK